MNLFFLLIIFARIGAVLNNTQRFLDFARQLGTALTLGPFDSDSHGTIGIDGKLDFLFYCHFFTVKVMTLSCLVSSMSRV